MAISRGPKLVTNGLVLALDASDDNSFAAQNLPIKNGLLLWLDAADDDSFVYSSGTFVSQWRDKSGLNNHTNQSNVTYQPQRNTFTNSRKTTVFNSSYLTTQTNILKAYTSYTKIAVVKQTSNTVGNIIGKSTGADTTFWYNGSNNIRLYHNSNTILTSSVATTLNTWSILSGLFDSNLLNANIYVNGDSGGSATSPTVTQITTDSDVEIGGFNGAANYFAGEISEILIYNRALSLTELKKVHTYLGQKWGISNTDRQIFDLSGNNFNFSFNGPNPRYNAKTIVSNFDTSSPYTVSAFGGQNLTSTVLNLLYLDHTIEVAVNPKGFRSVYSYNNALTTQTVQGIVLWTGQHSGLYFEGTTLCYLYWNTTSTTVSLSYNAASYQDKIMYITATRTGDVLRLYINGVLVAGPTTVAASTSPISYSQINIGTAYQGNPTTQGYVWAGQHEYHLLRMYSRRLTDTEVVSNYQAFKARFDNNIVRYGLILDLDAGNPYSYAGAGTTWYDVSGAGNDFTIQGNVTWNATNGFSNFDGNSTGSGNKIYRNSFPQNLKTSQGGNGYTIIVVARSTVFGGWRKLIANGDGENYIDLYQNNTGATWHQDGSGETLYVDGVQVNNDTYVMDNAGFHFYGATNLNNGSVTNPAYALTIGNEPNSSPNGTNAYPWIGNIAIVLMYNRVLTTTELLQNYNALKGRFGL